MARFDFCGPSYTSRSITADGERCVNLYPEIIEGHGKNKLALYQTPGLRLLTTLPSGPVYGFGTGTLISPITGGGVPVTLVVGGSNLYSIDASTGSVALIGNVGASGPVKILNNGKEFLIVTGAGVYRCDFTALQALRLTGPLASLPFFRANSATYLDGYFIVSDVFSRNFYISGLYDGSTWDALDFGVKQGATDNISAVFADHKELWLFGDETTEPFYDSGNANFPFQVIQGAIVEQGLAARDSIAKLDNSIFWLGSSARGDRTVWRVNGYTPVRVSNHAVENAWSQYSTVSDAVAYGYEEAGHSFYVLHFPTADATWVYDVSTQMWHERGYWDGAAYHAHWGRYHVYTEGVHLVGDYRNGRIYKQSITYSDDAGTPIRWMRTAPHICDELKRVRYNSLTIDAEPGISATISMQFSDNGGKTWSHVYTDSLSATDVRARVHWHRLGMGRDRVFRVYGTQPVSLIDAYADIQKGAE